MIEDVALVESSWRGLSRDAASFARCFYARLFEREPALRGLFRSPEPVIEQHFAQGLGATIASLRSPEVMRDHVEALVGAHVGYGVRREDYLAFFAVLLGVLRDFSGEAWSPAVERAWVAALASLFELVERAFDELARGEPTPDQERHGAAGAAGASPRRSEPPGPKSGTR
jgi:hemoglobin-like flavoprotein